MNIAIFQPYSILKPGGVQDHVRSQAEQLRKNGHSVTILTPRPRKYSGEAPENTIFTGVSARVRAADSSPDVSTTMDQQEVDALYSQNHFDVVHFHEPVVPFVGRQLIAQCPYPVVATLHAAMPENTVGRTLGSIKPYFRSVLQHVDVLTRVSIAAGEYLEEVISDVETYYVPNGIELKEFKDKNNISRQEQTILYIGRFEKRKGPKYLVKAFSILQAKYPNARLILAGDGHDRSSLEELIAELGLRNVELPGYIDTEYKKELLATSTVACYPALYGESFGIVLLEALASGIPIVAGRNPGYESVLKEIGGLSLVDVKDVAEFAHRLELFLDNPSIRDFYAKWGKEYVKQFDYAQIVSTYEKIYGAAIKKHSS
jgi:phosphatidylinositol alpha-mannosyltransferase